MDFALSDEQQMIVDTVRSFTERELFPHEEQVEKLGEVPPELVQQIKKRSIDAGLYAANMPAGCWRVWRRCSAARTRLHRTRDRPT